MTNDLFDYNLTEQYRLCLRISAERFTFALHDKTGKPAFYSRDYSTDRERSLTANLKTIFKDNPFAGRTFRHADILLANTPCVAIPREEFEEERAESLYYGCMPRENRQTVFHHALPQENPVLLYAADRTFCQLLLEQLPGAHICASVLPVLEYLHRRSLTDDQRKLFVHFHDRRMDVSAYEPGKLLLHNTFRSTQGADVVYYLLYIWQQLGFDQQKDELYLIGRVPDQEHTLRELHRFLAEVAFIHPAAEFKRAAYARGDADFEIQADFALS